MSVCQSWFPVCSLLGFSLNCSICSSIVAFSEFKLKVSFVLHMPDCSVLLDPILYSQYNSYVVMVDLMDATRQCRLLFTSACSVKD